MKKILALVLALMMTLSCAGVLAEAPAPETEPETEISVHADPGEGKFTTTASLTVDAETLQMILGMMDAVDEEQMPVIATILNLVNGLSGKLSMFRNGAQVDLQLQETPIVSLAGAAVEGGSELVVGSDLIPNYLILVSQEYVSQITEQLMGKLQDMAGASSGAQADIDTQALANAIMPYLTEVVAAIQEKIGEPEMGEYTFEDATFQAKVPINMTVKEALLLCINALKGMLQEEAVASAVATVGSTVGREWNVEELVASLEEKAASIEEASEEDMPAADVALYMGMDEDGNQNVYFVAELTKEEETMLFCGGKVNGAYYGHINIFEMLTLDASAGMEEGVLHAVLNASFQNLFMGIDAQLAGLSNVTVALYFMNPMAPIATISLVTVPGAESTLALDSEGKTIVTIEDLMNDESGAAVQGLMTDLSTYGLMGLLSKAASIMPEDVSVLMSLLSGSPVTQTTLPAED